MHKFLLTWLLGILLFGGVSMTAYAADCTKDTPIDRGGDWVATLGKKGMEKDQVLAQRKAERLAACIQKQAKAVVADAKKAGKDMQKKLGF